MMPALESRSPSSSRAPSGRTLEAIDTVATIETLVFVLRHMPFGRSRILHVGCGDADLAALLEAYGHRVVTIDCSTGAVGHAASLGVEAELAELSGLDEDAFDAIVFTGALRRAESLRAALLQARKLLKPSGRLIVEGFSREELDRSTERWLHAMVTRLRTARFTTRGRQRRPRSAAAPAIGMASLLPDDGEDECSMARLERAIGEFFDLCVVERAPYLYRALCDLVPRSRCGFDFLREALRNEAGAIEAGRIPAVGRRIAARPLD